MAYSQEELVKKSRDEHGDTWVDTLLVVLAGFLVGLFSGGRK